MKREHVRRQMQVKSAERLILSTLADSVNFSCSGLLWSSYRTTPSGPLADAGLPSPTAPPRLPLATSSWVSRRLQVKQGKEDRRISLRYGCRLMLCWLCRCTRTLLMTASFLTSFHILAISLLLLCFTSEKYSRLVLDYLALEQNYASNEITVLSLSILLYLGGNFSQMTSNSLPQSDPP